MRADFKITVDQFVKDPRVCLCKSLKCRHNMGNKKGPNGGELTCHFRMIEIGHDGECQQFEKEQSDA